MRSLRPVQLGARACSGGGSPAGQDVGSSASPAAAMFDDGQPLLCGSWEAGCGHSHRSSSGHGHAVAEGPRLARTWRRMLGGLTWQKLMISARRQSPESRGCVLLPVHCWLRDGHVVIFYCTQSSYFSEYLSLCPHFPFSQQHQSRLALQQPHLQTRSQSQAPGVRTQASLLGTQFSP